jgi:hypothetical protein
MTECVSPKNLVVYDNVCTLSQGETANIILVEKITASNLCDAKKATILFKKVSSLSSPFFVIQSNGEVVIKKNNYYRLEFNVYPEGCPGKDFSIHADFASMPSGFRLTELLERPNHVLIEGVFPVGTTLSLTTNPYELKYFCALEVRGVIGVSNIATQVEDVIKYDTETKVIYVSSTGRPLNFSPPLPPPNIIAFPPVGANVLLPAQYPTNTTSYPWTVPIIPHKFDQPIPPPLQGQVPVPPVPTGAVNIVADKFNKRNSVPRVIYYYVGDDVTQCPNDSDISVFLKNYENRGKDNDFKKQYMSAVTVDKLHFYQEKVEAFMNAVFSKVTIYNKPLISTFQKELILFFLRIHVGEDDYPQYVIDYFSTFIDVLGAGNPNDTALQLALMFGHVTIQKVLDYYKERVKIIRATEDKSTIVYWWNLAGFPDDTTVHESIHNIVAFSQLTNSVYSMVLSTIPQFQVVSPVPGFPKLPNFIREYNDAKDAATRVNVIREAMRLLVPNSASFSDVEMKEHPGVRVQARHVHQQIMIDNQDDTDPGKRTAKYFTYDTNRYPGFNNVNLDYDYVAGLTAIDEWRDSVFTSNIDGETIIDRIKKSNNVGDAQLIPVFPKPLYNIFGSGYRGCAGQSMSIYDLGRFAKKFANVEWEYRTDKTYDKVSVAPFKQVYDNLYMKV